MSWTHADTVDRCDEIADHMESFDPSGAEVVPGAEYLLMRAARRQAADAAELASSVAEARDAGTTWVRIGEILGLGPAEAEQLYGHERPRPQPATSAR